MSVLTRLAEVFAEAVTLQEGQLVLTPPGAHRLHAFLHGYVNTPELVPLLSEVMRIADFALHTKASPQCAAQLADLGEAVLKFARVLGDDAVAPYFEALPPEVHTTGAPMVKLKEHYQALAPSHHWYRPIGVDLELTQKCNLRCGACAIIDDVERGYDGLTGDAFIEILKSCEGTSIFSFSVIGGEPFLRLDDICRALTETSLELDRLLTNAKVFSSKERTAALLTKLLHAGIRTRNRSLRPTINISIGIQTAAGAPLANAAHLIAGIFELFDDDVGVVLNALPSNNVADAHRALLAELAEIYFAVNGAHLPWERIRTTQKIFMEYTPRAAALGKVDLTTETLAERFARDEAHAACPNFVRRYAENSTPRCLVRADRTFYACSCFGYVAPVGTVTDSIAALIARANDDVLLRRVVEGGVRALYEDQRAADPSVAQRVVPRAAGICKVCKALRQPGEELYPPPAPLRVLQ